MASVHLCQEAEGAADDAATSVPAGPIILVTHEGRYTTFLLLASAGAGAGGVGSGFAPRGMYSFHVGIARPETLFRAAEIDAMAEGPSTFRATSTRLRKGGTTVVIAPMRFERASAAAAALGCEEETSSARSDLTSSPVLILTGHFSWHIPSAAHISFPMYSNEASRSFRRCSSSAVRGPP